MVAPLQTDELAHFSALAAAGSLTAAARELNVSTAAVSKRLSAAASALKCANSSV
ncbi:MAG TPA: LysR family transcriptional regulator [Casimicrobiaceae bacterium]|nr:LysR family transcriptional regulator [Casimicrobiaceae bacterium]